MTHKAGETPELPPDVPLAPPASAEPAPPPRRRRGWKILLVLAVVLAALALFILFFGPPLAASIARSQIETLLGSKLASSVTVGRLSLSWSGGVELEDLKIVPRGFPSPLLHLKGLRADVSLASALGGTYVARVELTAPRITIERDASGRFNYEFPRREAPTEGGTPEPPPAGAVDRPCIRAVVAVREGEILFRDADRQTAFRNVTADVRVDTLEKPVEFALSLENPTHGRLSVKGSFDVDRKRGQVLLAVENLSLRNWAAVAAAYGNIRGLEGTVEGTFDYRLEGLPACSGKGHLDLRDLGLEAGGRKIRLERLSLFHEGALDARGGGRQKLRISSGAALDLEAAADLDDAFAAPMVKAEISGGADLAELGKMVREAAGFKSGVRMEGRVKVRGRVEARAPDLRAGVSGISSRGDLQLEAADVAAVEGEGRRYEIDRLISLKLAGSWDGKVSAAVLEDLRLDASFASAEGRGGISVGKEVEIRDSSLRIRADLEALVGRLKGLLEQPPALGGAALVSATFAGERLEVDGDLKGLRFGGVGPVDAVLHHEGTVDRKGSGRHRFRLESGRAFRMEGQLEAKDLVSEERFVSGRAEVEGDLELLAGMFPGLLEIPPGRIPSGSVTVSADLEAKGASSVKFDVRVGASNLALADRAGGERKKLEKSAMLSARGAWEGARSFLGLEAVRVSTSGVELEGRAGISLADRWPAEASFSLRLDLEAVGAWLPPFVADPPGLAGSMVVEGNFATDRYEVRTAVRALNVVLKGTAGATKVGPIDASVVQRGIYRPAEGRLRIEENRIVSAALDLAVEGEFRRVTGATREGDLKVDVGVHPAELSKWFPGMDLEGPEARASAGVTLRPGSVAATGKVRVEGLKMKSRDRAGAAVVQVLRAVPLEFFVEAKEGDVRGRVRADVFEWTDGAYAAKGGILGEGAWGGGKVLSGTAKIVNLEIRDATRNVLQDPAVTVAWEVGLSPGNYEIRRAEVVSTILGGGLAGAMRDTGGDLEFVGVRGSFRYVPERLGAVLAPWMPGRLEGVEEKALEVRLSGRAVAGDFWAVLQGGEGSVDVDLARYTHTGVSVSGMTRLDLKGGRARSATPLQVNGGRTKMDLELDFRRKEERPRSALVFGAREVGANADMGPLLEKIHPIFYTNRVGATVDGKVDAEFTLVWEGPIDPLEKDWMAAAGRRLGGKGSFSGRNLSIVGSPAVEQLMAALGEGNRLEGELVAPEIRVGEGRCAYENMTLRLKRYELRFKGWVGFDRSMKLMVEMPMTEHLVRKYPNLQKYIGKTFFVPLEGTVDRPRFDFEVAVAELLRRAAEGVIQEKARDLLDDLLKKWKKDKDKSK